MTEEEAIVAAEAEEAIKDKDKSSHRLIGGSNKDEGSDSDSGGVSSEGLAKFRWRSGEGSVKVRRRSGEGPAKVRWRSGEGPAKVRRDSGGGGWKIPVNSGFTNKNWTLNPQL